MHAVQAVCKHWTRPAAAPRSCCDAHRACNAAASSSAGAAAAQEEEAALKKAKEAALKGKKK
jgi:hypothetical protein